MHYSQYFNLGHREFVETGAFNGFTDADSQLHIDPMLLKVCNEPEFQTAFQDYLQFFNEIVVLVENVEHDNMTDRCYRAIYNKLQFPEKVNSGLGYSRSNTKGSGISSRLSLQLTESCIDIVRRGVKNPVFFTLLPFIEKGIGADRISDMVISVLSNHFAQYTKRVCEELSIITKRCKLNGDICYLPLINKKPYLFIPQAILAHLPLARSYDDIDTVCHYNKVLREKICKAIGISWTEFERLNKNQRKDIILNNSALYKDIMEFYDKMVHFEWEYKRFGNSKANLSKI